MIRVLRTTTRCTPARLQADDRAWVLQNILDLQKDDEPA
jgi:hypothetical protein